MNPEQAEQHIQSLIAKLEILRTREMSEPDRKAAIEQVTAEIHQLRTITGPGVNTATVHITIPIPTAKPSAG